MTTKQQPSRYQAMTNARIALCDQLPPAYAQSVGRLTTMIADHTVKSATFAGGRGMDHAAAAIDALTQLLDELTDAMTAQARIEAVTAGADRG